MKKARPIVAHNARVISKGLGWATIIEIVGKSRFGDDNYAQILNVTLRVYVLGETGGYGLVLVLTGVNRKWMNLKADD